MEKISVFLLLVSVLQFLSKNSSFGIEINNKCSTLFQKVKGEALTGHTISVHQTRSELDCSHKCLSNPKCTSFNFEIQQSRSLSTCDLNNVSRISSNNKLKRNDSFAYYEPITLMERPKQEIAAFRLTTGNLITEATTTQGTQEIGTSQDQAATPASSVPSTQPAITAAPVSNCGQHWHTYKSGCLRLLEDRKDWVAANQHCATFNTCSGGNGRLISIFSQVDSYEIGNFTSSLACPQGEYYIGLNDLNGTGTYKWADGTAASLTNWINGYPNGKKVVVMKVNADSNNGKWRTQDYNKPLRFICECLGVPCEYYIGLNDLNDTGTYKWADGTAGSFTNWNNRHPRDGKGVVMKMNGHSDKGKWETTNYSNAERFICEWPGGPCNWNYFPTLPKICTITKT